MGKHKSVVQPAGGIEMKMRRVWAMPNSETFSIKPVRAFIDEHLAGRDVVVDPFARNAQIASITNDLNPETSAQYHMDSVSFLEMLARRNLRADAILFDPPYSPRQIKECYDGIGMKMGALEAMRTNWTPERNLIAKILKLDGIVLSFNWNSNGMGKQRGFHIINLLLVAHGSGHNDLICIAETRL